MSIREAEQRQREQGGTLLRNYIAEPEAAIELGVDKRTLRQWRRTGKGPPGHLKIGRCIYYRAEVIEAWLRSLEAKPVRRVRS
jgi:predicted site-specific integrase-resolvase